MQISSATNRLKQPTEKFLFSASLVAADSISLFTPSTAQAETVNNTANLKTENIELFNLFNDTVNHERLAVDENNLPELFADSLRWHGLASAIDVYFNRINDPTEVPKPVAAVGLILVGALGLSQKHRRQKNAA